MVELSAPIAAALAGSPLTDLGALPLLPPESVAGWGPTLVVAPHQDDESLGCGGAIALLARANVPVLVVFVSDGSKSHLDSPSYPPERLRETREAEALAALGHLGLATRDATFLRLPDSAVPQAGRPGFDTAVEAVRALLQAWRPATILLPWRRDRHADHVASWQIVRAAVGKVSVPPRFLEYPIWLWDSTEAFRTPTEREARAWRLDIAPVLPQKLAAIDAHRSQLTDLIDDAREAFRLDPVFLENFGRPWEVFLEG